MNTRIEVASRTAWVYLRKDWQQLAADARGGAGPRVLAADKAALIESRRQVARTQGSHLVDVTV